jgi:hypothetical protein
MKGQVVLVSRLAARDLRRRPVEALMVVLVIAAAATTLTVALALSGVTNKPYQQTGWPRPARMSSLWRVAAPGRLSW